MWLITYYVRLKRGTETNEQTRISNLHPALFCLQLNEQIDRDNTSHIATGQCVITNSVKIPDEVYAELVEKGYGGKIDALVPAALRVRKAAMEFEANYPIKK